MKENLTNVGKKEQRQINQLLNKEAKEGPQKPQGSRSTNRPQTTQAQRKKRKIASLWQFPVLRLHS
jgi:hypothetical protein